MIPNSPPRSQNNPPRQEPDIADLDADIESIPNLPVCNFCSGTMNPLTFETYKKLVQHRIEYHRNKTPYESEEIPEIEVQLQTEVTFIDIKCKDIELWTDDLEIMLNTPLELRPILKWDIHYTQKNLRPLD